jgi:hypothetical protein
MTKGIKKTGPGLQTILPARGILFLTLTLLLYSSLVTAQDKKNDSGFIPAFELKYNPVGLARAAQPNQYFNKIGRKAALMGYENGRFEMWIWPWKPFRNFELQFYLGTSTTPIRQEEILRTISVTPEATTITFSYESFSVKEIIIVPYNEPGAIILLQVNTQEPLTIVPGFLPVMQPQWPAGAGGQYSYWMDDINAFLISASGHKSYFLCGSPCGKQMTAPPAHMFADNPLQFKIEVTPEQANNNYIPIIIAGGVNTAADSVKALYQLLWQNAETYYNDNFEIYKRLSESTVQVITPVEKINLAFEWGKAALHNLLVDNPNLGLGLVAGYGLSGGGARPGFSWYFGGDAYINSLPINSYQDFTTVKDALKFTQKWQRQENFPVRKKSPDEINKDIGKMAHELSQSEGIIDWWNDYHYGYNHADTTPWYLVAMGDYYRQSGDVQFIKDSWKSIVQAFEWCLGKDSDGDGLMDLKGAGLGVLEFGSLVKIHNDLYTQAMFVQGLKELALMASAAGDKNIEAKAASLASKAAGRLEELYWNKKLGFYSFGANEAGEQVSEKSIYASSAIMLGLLDEANSISTLEKFSGSDMVTDWGVRNLPDTSKYFHYANYNYGAVWPYTSYLIASAQYKYHRSLQGYFILLSTIDHIFDNGLGVSPEVFSGAANQKLGEAYHNQGFSVSGYIEPLMNGLLGIEADAINNKLTFSPNLPADWDSLTIKNIKVGNKTADIFLKREDDKVILNIESSGRIDFEFTPSFGPGTKLISAALNGTVYKAEEKNYPDAFLVSTGYEVNGKSVLELKLNGAPEVFLLPLKTSVGETNRGLKVVSQKLAGNELHIIVDGLSGEEYNLGLRNNSNSVKISGAKSINGILNFTIEGKNTGKFKRHEIIITQK